MLMSKIFQIWLSVNLPMVFVLFCFVLENFNFGAQDVLAQLALSMPQPQCGISSFLVIILTMKGPQVYVE